MGLRGGRVTGRISWGVCEDRVNTLTTALDTY